MVIEYLLVVDVWSWLFCVLFLCRAAVVPAVFVFRLFLLALADRSLPQVDLAAAVRLSECRVVEITCKSGFEVEPSFSSFCFSRPSSAYVAVSWVLVLSGEHKAHNRLFGGVVQPCCTVLPHVLIVFRAGNQNIVGLLFCRGNYARPCLIRCFMPVLSFSFPEEHVH